MNDRTFENRAQDSAALLNNAADGIEESVAWHTVGIVSDRGGPNNGPSIGTGVAVFWKAHHLILTAHHVIENLPQDELWFLFRRDGALLRRDRIDTLSSDDIIRLSSPRQPIAIQRILRSADMDLAAIEVSGGLENEQNLKFYELDPSPLSAESLSPSLVLMGYPSDAARQVIRGGYAVFPMFEWTRAREMALDRYNPETDFLVDYNSHDERHPRGLSGSGVWAHKTGSTLWGANLWLVGVCTHYRESRSLLQCVKIELIKQFLERDCLV